MKELHELILPDDIRYTDEHEWARITGETARIGVSDYAQDQLGDIVFVEMPAVGETFAKGEVFGTLESVKAVSELYLPLSGEVSDGEQFFFRQGMGNHSHRNIFALFLSSFCFLFFRC